MKKYIAALLLISLVGVFGACVNDSINIVEEESFYSDFYVENDVVYINCTLTVEATKDQSVCFVGDFADEAEIGLLKEKSLETTSFNIQKGKQTIDVTFIGSFGGNNKKADRKLPDISIATR